MLRLAVVRMTQPPHYTLKYFNVRALGEAIRQIFAYADVPFNDVRFDREHWATSEEKKKVPYGTLPVLEFDGHQISQSQTIARFLARQYGLAGKTPLEEAKVDSIAEAFKDYWWFFVRYNRHASGLHKIIPNAPGTLESTYEELLPARDKLLNGVETYLAESTSGFLVSSGVTWPDFLITENLASAMNFRSDYLDEREKVKEWVKRVRELPKIKHWIETRPKGDFDA